MGKIFAYQKHSKTNDRIYFDIVARNHSAGIVRKKIKQFTDVTNDWMKKMGVELGFEFKLTTPQ